MKFIVIGYYSGYCCYEIEAENEDEAHEKSLHSLVNKSEALSTMEQWEECDKIEADIEG